MTILVDVDNTLNDLSTPFIERVHELGYEFDKTKYTSWELADAVIAPNPKEVVAGIFNNPDFWRQLKPRPGSYNSLAYLNDRHKVIIATIPWRPTPEHREAKIRWLGYYFPFIKENQISFRKDKWNLPGDVIIDDKPETIKKCIDAGMITIMPSHPYNVDIPADVTFSSWKEIPKLFDNIDQLIQEATMS